ncbi:cytochrome P450 78A7-like [Telopea speciosissima]|uniref:cytochrome P450 78A7-like n=1 Tax=Telopea speciosissima TaxID=54955 RepID=UPI001CC450F1|nr:cytochrome P450 78A7-like [Telopea speciosissima]
MELGLVSKDSSWWVFTLPAVFGIKNALDLWALFCLLLAFMSVAFLTWAFTPGGRAWRYGRNQRGTTSIPGPRGLPLFGSLFHLSRGLAHRSLSSMASTIGATKLMAFSLGSTPVVVSSDPQIAKEILTSSHFADRPIKQSARMLMFSRAIGFAPNGTYWRLLRRIASSHLFAPKRIAAHEVGRQLDCAAMLLGIVNEQSQRGAVVLRKHLQAASLNNIMGSVFGKRYDVGHESQELIELREMVEEGFELLGSFNWSDYLPWLSFFYDPFCIKQRCASLVPRVRKFVRGIIEEHRLRGCDKLSDNADFVDVLLSLDGDEKLEEDDMIAVLWEMIFRGTDTTALLTEWVMAELVLNQEVQTKLREEIEMVVGERGVRDVDVANLPYLQSVIKETLRIHPPGPLLSWARLSTSDVQLSNEMVIPAHTTAMVNMWAITHDPMVWEEPLVFKPERFIDNNVDVKGNDLRLAPFGAGRRVCPGKNLGLVTVNLWVAKLIQNFKWVSDPDNPVDLTEVLKLSCEMKHTLSLVAIPRNDLLCPSLF